MFKLTFSAGSILYQIFKHKYVCNNRPEPATNVNGKQEMFQEMFQQCWQLTESENAKPAQRFDCSQTR